MKRLLIDEVSRTFPGESSEDTMDITESSVGNIFIQKKSKLLT